MSCNFSHIFFVTVVVYVIFRVLEFMWQRKLLLLTLLVVGAGFTVGLTVRPIFHFHILHVHGLVVSCVRVFFFAAGRQFVFDT